ncbi:MAG: MaoC family dehydratase N-terminal domain-containing protein [Microthrixaceae bacterium]|nr:MaoC family dehydratase N-terminal domain-containing protein [Microthrixaceae bacterium]
MTDPASDPHDELPASVVALIDQPQYPVTADFDVERSYAYNTLAATQNANPLLWDDDVAADLAGGPIMPPTTISLWMRPHYWQPGAAGEQVALQVHFDLKATFDLPEAVMTDNTITFHEPVRPGDRISHAQVLRSVSPPKTTKLGSGRFWVIDVEFRNQHDVLVGVERYTGFGYRRES